MTARQAWREMLAADKARRQQRSLKADLLSTLKRAQFERALERATLVCAGRDCRRCPR